MDKILTKVLEKNKEVYIHYLEELVALDTQVIGHGIDGGYEKNGQMFLEKILLEMGAKVKRELLNEKLIQKGIKLFNEGNPGHNYADRYNLTACFEGDKKGRSILFNGHVDTMPPGDMSLWDKNPWQPTIKDGKLFGLGACDMKAGLMASIMAVKLLQDANIDLPGDVKITSVVDEEGGGNGSLAAMLNGHRADAAVVCEPTDYNLTIGHMGFIFFKVDVTGVALHSGTKWKGVNAIEKAIFLIDALQELEHRWLMLYKHPFLPSPTLNIGVIEGGTAGSTVPDKCTFKLCLHYLPNLMTYESVVKEVTDSLMLRSQGDSWLMKHPPEISIYQAGGAFEISSEDSFVKTAKKVMGDVMGNPPILNGSNGGNDARLLKNIGKMPTVVMGPGSLEQCHVVNEYVKVEDYLQFILIYAKLILNWCKNQ
ncbi:M20 family metallopeptidase [Maledivibacter halophilus]|uniref:Acetylornithine deacetylase n=1 Tax=Maledivibacter halophilus TaxID=36842 RepID=A0A1T5M680_9FIRM|nr:ArgE/DapE family deacylase [Maledivibacter halophilus]SKC83534.1 acetylornithine deacetylase [Maledivibacter halophilus]